MGHVFRTRVQKGEDISEAVRQTSSIVGQLSHFISQIWSDKNYIFLLNLIIFAVVYLTLIFIINRFWIATAIFGTVMTVYAVANHIKIESRNEPVLPADLNFITGGNTGQLASFILKAVKDLPIQQLAASYGLSSFALSCSLSMDAMPLSTVPGVTLLPGLRTLPARSLAL